MKHSLVCPKCGHAQVDEYTHYECPPGSTTSDHRHLVCANASCNHEWTEPVPQEAAPGASM